MDADIEAFRDQLRRYVHAELLPHLDGWRKQGDIPREVWRPFGALGFLLPELPEAYGGAGTSLAYQSAAASVIESAVELTVGYTQQRQAFGQRVADFQNTRFKLAECATLAHVVRSFVNDCAQRLLDGTLDVEAAYMAK